MTEYDLELEKILKEIKDSKAKIVGLQFPEGLRNQAIEIAEKIEEKGATVIVFIDPVYGACDTKEAESRLLGVDLIIHFGHTGFL